MTIKELGENMAKRFTPNKKNTFVVEDYKIEFFENNGYRTIRVLKGEKEIDEETLEYYMTLLKLAERYI